jgi:hypothetical protein
MAADPASVWKLVERADELVKYAQNRDPQTAYRQARAVLDEAEALAGQLDEKAATGLRAQIETRRADIARYDTGNSDTGSSGAGG